MTKAELLELLDGMPDETEIRIMTQYNYPFEYSVCSGIDDLTIDEHTEDFTPHAYKGAPIFYLAEGTQLGYGTQAAWQ